MPCWAGSERKGHAMKVDTPAKLNMNLRVLGRREDGFHELETLMVPVPGLADTLLVEEAEEFSFACEGADLPLDESNLVVKALRAFERKTWRECRYRIVLTKRVPHGGGLGGGSSNAASMLQVLNDLEGAGLEPGELESLAADLGSDVPFFLRGGACWCRGRGELLDPAAVARHEVLLLKPAFGVSTPDAYGRWQDSRELPGVLYAPQEIGGTQLVNDLERPVFGKHLFLAEMKMWLLDQEEVQGTLMSGSGATVFAVLKDGIDGESLAQRARKELDPGLWSWAGTVGG